MKKYGHWKRGEGEYESACYKKRKTRGGDVLKRGKENCRINGIKRPKNAPFWAIKVRWGGGRNDKNVSIYFHKSEMKGTR